MLEIALAVLVVVTMMSGMAINKVLNRKEISSVIFFTCSCIFQVYACILVVQELMK